ncbi:hypothetical protein [Longibaculum muris]|uniref:hypothetical protein n=1 Tax=Longibaculum muris TaxID=1796628 RepID=UPI0022E5CCE2|nr:hypothetical protein [Longibaculum muris]
MKYKGIIGCLCLLMLVGCGTTKKEEPTQGQKGLYVGLDGKQTYSEAVKYFNSRVNYYFSEATDETSDTYNEYYKGQDHISLVSKALYNDADVTTLNYSIADGKDFHTLFMVDSQTYAYDVAHDYNETIDAMYPDLTKDENSELLSAERKDQNGQIELTLKVKRNQQYQENDSSEIVYFVSQLKISKDGYIVEDKVTYYTDDKFEEVAYEGLTTTYKDFNKKKSDDLQKEIDLMKSCDGMNDDEVKAELHLES